MDRTPIHSRLRPGQAFRRREAAIVARDLTRIGHPTTRATMLAYWRRNRKERRFASPVFRLLYRAYVTRP